MKDVPPMETTLYEELISSQTDGETVSSETVSSDTDTTTRTDEEMERTTLDQISSTEEAVVHSTPSEETTTLEKDADTLHKTTDYDEVTTLRSEVENIPEVEKVIVSTEVPTETTTRRKTSTVNVAGDKVEVPDDLTHLVQSDAVDAEVPETKLGLLNNNEVSEYEDVSSTTTDFLSVEMFTTTPTASEVDITSEGQHQNFIHPDRPATEEEVLVTTEGYQTGTTLFDNSRSESTTMTNEDSIVQSTTASGNEVEVEIKEDIKEMQPHLKPIQDFDVVHIQNDALEEEPFKVSNANVQEVTNVKIPEEKPQVPKDSGTTVTESEYLSITPTAVLETTETPSIENSLSLTEDTEVYVKVAEGQSETTLEEVTTESVEAKDVTTTTETTRETEAEIEENDVEGAALENQADQETSTHQSSSDKEISENTHLEVAEEAEEQVLSQQEKVKENIVPQADIHVDNIQSDETEQQGNLKPGDLLSGVELKEEEIQEDIELKPVEVQEDMAIKPVEVQNSIQQNPDESQNEVDLKAEEIHADVESKPLEQEVPVKPIEVHDDTEQKPKESQIEVELKEEDIHADIELKPVEYEEVQPKPIEVHADTEQRPKESQNEVELKEENIHADIELKPVEYEEVPPKPIEVHDDTEQKPEESQNEVELKEENIHADIELKPVEYEEVPPKPIEVHDDTEQESKESQNEEDLKEEIQDDIELEPGVLQEVLMKQDDTEQKLKESLNEVELKEEEVQADAESKPDEVHEAALKPVEEQEMELKPVEVQDDTEQKQKESHNVVSLKEEEIQEDEVKPLEAQEEIALKPVELQDNTEQKQNEPIGEKIQEDIELYPVEVQEVVAPKPVEVQGDTVQKPEDEVKLEEEELQTSMESKPLKLQDEAGPEVSDTKPDIELRSPGVEDAGQKKTVHHEDVDNSALDAEETYNNDSPVVIEIENAHLLPEEDEEVEIKENPSATLEGQQPSNIHSDEEHPKDQDGVGNIVVEKTQINEEAEPDTILKDQSSDAKDEVLVVVQPQPPIQHDDETLHEMHEDIADMIPPQLVYDTKEEFVPKIADEPQKQNVPQKVEVVIPEENPPASVHDVSEANAENNKESGLPMEIDSLLVGPKDAEADRNDISDQIPVDDLVSHINPAEETEIRNEPVPLSNVNEDSITDQAEDDSMILVELKPQQDPTLTLKKEQEFAEEELTQQENNQQADIPENEVSEEEVAIESKIEAEHLQVKPDSIQHDAGIQTDIEEISEEKLPLKDDNSNPVEEHAHLESGNENDLLPKESVDTVDETINIIPVALTRVSTKVNSETETSSTEGEEYTEKEKEETEEYTEERKEETEEYTEEKKEETAEYTEERKEETEEYTEETKEYPQEVTTAGVIEEHITSTTTGTNEAEEGDAVAEEKKETPLEADRGSLLSGIYRIVHDMVKENSLNSVNPSASRKPLSTLKPFHTEQAIVISSSSPQPDVSSSATPNAPSYTPPPPVYLLNNFTSEQMAAFFGLNETDSSSSLFFPGGYVAERTKPETIPEQQVDYEQPYEDAHERPEDAFDPVQGIRENNEHFNSFIREQPYPVQAVFTRDFGAPRKKREILTPLDPVNCEWTMQTEPGLYLLVTFHNLSATPTIDCQGAYIEVEREGNGYEARWCGNRLTQGGSRPHVIFAKGEVRLTVFDDGTEGKGLPTGFDAEIEVIDLFDARQYSNFRNSDAYQKVRKLMGRRRRR